MILTETKLTIKILSYLKIIDQTYNRPNFPRITFLLNKTLKTSPVMYFH